MRMSSATPRRAIPIRHQVSQRCAARILIVFMSIVLAGSGVVGADCQHGADIGCSCCQGELPHVDQGLSSPSCCNSVDHHAAPLLRDVSVVRNSLAHDLLLLQPEGKPTQRGGADENTWSPDLSKERSRSKQGRYLLLICSFLI